MGFNNFDYEWINMVYEKPDVYAFRISDASNGKRVEIIDNFTGETVHIFALEAEYFLRQLLDFCGFVVVDN